MNEKELAAAMEKMDGDGGGEVEFMEFYRWWQSDETKALLGGAIHRMEKVKEMFDQLDDDMSGLLDREEVRNLAL